MKNSNYIKAAKLAIKQLNEAAEAADAENGYFKFVANQSGSKPKTGRFIDLKDDGGIPKTIEEATDSVFDEYAITVEIFRQFAIGITGRSQKKLAYINKDTGRGFKTKRAAMLYAKANDLKSYRKQQNGRGGAGSTGRTVNAVKIRDIIYKQTDRYNPIEEFYGL